MEKPPRDLLQYVFSFVPLEKKNWLHVKCVCKTWLEISEAVFSPAMQHNLAIRWASRIGKLELVKKLLNDPRVDPAAGKLKVKSCILVDFF